MASGYAYGLCLISYDAVLFVNPTRQDVDNVLEIMRHFGKATGLCMNMTKSSVLPIRCGQVNLVETLATSLEKEPPFPPPTSNCLSLLAD
jgi:hypothetical protein